jgi:hypothetical protein
LFLRGHGLDVVATQIIEPLSTEQEAGPDQSERRD